MPDTAGPEWTRLGQLLRQRRAEIAPRFAVRAVFCAEHGLSKRGIHDIETGQRDNYTAGFFARVEAAYQLQAGSVARTLDGGPLEPADAGRQEAADDRQCRAELLAVTVAALTRPAEEQIRTEIRTRGRRVNARTMFANSAEQALWQQADTPEATRIRQIATCRLLREAAG